MVSREVEKTATMTFLSLSLSLPLSSEYFLNIICVLAAPVELVGEQLLHIELGTYNSKCSMHSLEVLVCTFETMMYLVT